MAGGDVGDVIWTANRGIEHIVAVTGCTAAIPSGQGAQGV